MLVLRQLLMRCSVSSSPNCSHFRVFFALCISRVSCKPAVLACEPHQIPEFMTQRQRAEEKLNSLEQYFVKFEWKIAQECLKLGRQRRREG